MFFIVMLVVIIGVVARFLVPIPRDMSLEEYIVSNDPQDVHDVERLERQYAQLQARKVFNY
jgi:hypothetical protein